MAYRCGWIGYGGTAYLAEKLRPIITGLGMEFCTIHEHRGNPDYPDADILWDRTTWLDHLKSFDIVVIPLRWEEQAAKSNNRLTQAMSLGKPVVANRLDAYVRIEQQYPGCCLFATTDEEWREQLRRLRDDKELYQDVSRKALEAAKAYSLDAIGQKWVKALEPATDVKIDIVIPTYKNLRGIKLCLDSIEACTSIPYEIFVVDNGENKEMRQYLQSRKGIRYIKTGKSVFAKAVNVGIKAGKGSHVLILNDDTILSRGALESMVGACTGNVGAVNPLSNCDYSWRHNYDLSIEGLHLRPGVHTFEEIEPIVSDIHSYESSYNDTPEQEWLAFYATLIPRPVIEKVGYLNESYVNSGEDYDYCMRIARMGYKMVHANKAFIFHFGAVSRKALEKEDYAGYHKNDGRTQQRMGEIWGKKSVMIYSGPSWEPWDFRSVDNGGIGGSETWVVWLSRELAKLNYRVTVFADMAQQEAMDGDVQWLHYTQHPSWADQYWTDYAILSRTTDPLKLSLRAGKVYVQIHDVWLLSDRDQLFLDKVDKFACLSQWHMDFASQYHGIPKDRMVMMANGIDFDRFDKIQVERHPHRLIWSSSWDRGLDNVLYLLPFIRQTVPDVELHIFYGNLNWKSNCQAKNDQEGLKKIQALEEAMKQPGVYVHGRVSQKQLAEEFQKSSLWLYPTWFSETFGITAIEAQYAGVPVIANKYAGLITTLGDSALLLGDGSAWYPYSKEGREEFLNETVGILTDNRKWSMWSKKGLENSKKYSWENAARQWKKIFEE